MGDLGPEILHIFSENTFQNRCLLVFVSLGEDKWGVLLSKHLSFCCLVV